MISRAAIVGIWVAFIVGASGPVAAQSPLTDAKALYANAAYEDALKLLDQVPATESVSEVHQYRALCLVALGRVDAAASAVALVVAADPFFTPNPNDVAPRVVAMFTDSRRKLLPPIVRSTFAEATALYKDGARDRATERFDVVLRLLNDPMLKDDRELGDLRLLATGFVDLARAQPTAQPPVASAAPMPTASPEAPAGSLEARPAEPSKAPTTTPPVAITQVFPQWRPPDVITARRALSGTIRLWIDREGKVTAATRERSVHPAYDPILLEAARGWRYKPATINGQPVASQTTVEVRLKPSED